MATNRSDVILSLTAEDRITGPVGKINEALTDVRKSFSDLEDGAARASKGVAGSANTVRDLADAYKVKAAVAVGAAAAQINSLESSIQRANQGLAQNEHRARVLADSYGALTRKLQEAKAASAAIAKPPANAPAAVQATYKDARSGALAAEKNIAGQIKNVETEQRRLASSTARLRGELVSANNALGLAAASKMRLNAELQRGAALSDRFATSTRGAAQAIRQSGVSAATTNRQLSGLRSTLTGLVAGYLGIGAAAEGTRAISRAFIDLETAQTRLSYVFAGNHRVVADEMAYLKKSADDFAINIRTVYNEYTKLSASTLPTGMSREDNQAIFEGVASAARVNNLSAEMMNRAFMAISQIAGKNRVQMEELRGQLGEALPGAVVEFAAALGYAGTEMAQFYKDVEAGKFDAASLVTFGRHLSEKYGDALEQARGTFSAELAKLQTEIFNAMIAIGDAGFIDTMKDSVKDLAAFLKSAEGGVYLRNIAQGASAAAKAFGLLLANIDKISVGLTAIAGIKIAGMFGGAAVGAAGALRSSTAMADALTAMRARAALLPAATGVAATGIAAVGTAAAGARVSLSAFVALMGGPWAAAIKLAVVGITALTAYNWNKKSQEAEGLARSNQAVADTVSKIAAAYREAAGDADKYAKSIDGLTAAENEVARKQVEQQTLIKRGTIVQDPGLKALLQGRLDAMEAENVRKSRSWDLAGMMSPAEMKAAAQAQMTEVEKLAAIFMTGGISARKYRDELDRLAQSKAISPELASSLQKTAREFEELEIQAATLDLDKAVRAGDMKAVEIITRRLEDLGVQMQETQDRTEEMAAASLQFAAALDEIKSVAPKMKREIDMSEKFSKLQQDADDARKALEKMKEEMAPEAWQKARDDLERTLNDARLVLSSDALTQRYQDMGIELHLGAETLRVLEQLGPQLMTAITGFSTPSDGVTETVRGGGGPATYSGGLTYDAKGRAVSSDPVAKGLKGVEVALLNAISKRESGGVYNIRYAPSGGKIFDLNGQHPNVRERTRNGKTSTAAGRYQFLKSTWDPLMGADTPFTPANQDLAAKKLAERDYRKRTGRDLWADLEVEGLTKDIAKALSPTWEAFTIPSAVLDSQKEYNETLARVGKNAGVAKSGIDGGLVAANADIKAGQVQVRKELTTEEVTLLARVAAATSSDISKDMLDAIQAAVLKTPELMSDKDFLVALSDGSVDKVASAIAKTDTETAARLRQSDIVPAAIRADESLVGAIEELSSMVKGAGSDLNNADLTDPAARAKAVDAKTDEIIVALAKLGVSLAQVTGTSDAGAARSAIRAQVDVQAGGEASRQSEKAAAKALEDQARATERAQDSLRKSRAQLAAEEVGGNTAAAERVRLQEELNELLRDGAQLSAADQAEFVANGMKRWQLANAERLEKEKTREVEDRQKEVAEKMARIQERLNALVARRKSLIESGASESDPGVTALDAEITGVRAELDAAIASAEALWKTMGGGDEAQAQLATLATMRTEINSGAEARQAAEEKMAQIQERLNALIERRKTLLDSGTSEQDPAIKSLDDEIKAVRDSYDEALAAKQRFWEGAGDSDLAKANLARIQAQREELRLAGDQSVITADAVRGAASMMTNHIASAFQGFITAVAEGENVWRALGQAVRSAVGNILIDIGMAIIRALVLKAVLSALNMIPGGSAIGGLILNPAAALGLPKFHDGGVVEKRRSYAPMLGHREVPAILEEGEEVITRDDPRHRYNMLRTTARRYHNGGIAGARADRVSADLAAATARSAGLAGVLAAPGRGGGDVAIKSVIVMDADRAREEMLDTRRGERAVLQKVGRANATLRRGMS